MNWRVVWLAFAMSSFGLLSAAVRAEAPWGEWQSPLGRENPSVGKIWSAEAKDFITPEAYAEALRRADVVLLGENHDNPDHHRLQAWALVQLASDKRPGAVVFEMMGPDEANALDSFIAGVKSPDDAAELGAAVKWDERGWPSWRMYEPIARAALAASYALRVGDAAPAQMRVAAKDGAAALGPEAETLRLNEPLDTGLQAALLEELFDGHCQMVDRAKLAPMAEVQRVRDATLADNLRRAFTGLSGGRAILIAGNGHVRGDRGVPLYLRGDKLNVVSVMHAELGAGGDDPLGQIPKAPDGTPAADFIWFTPGADRGDPCEVFRKMKKQN
jgi:uncharacterized iron-regulated protein